MLLGMKLLAVSQIFKMNCNLFISKLNLVPAQETFITREEVIASMVEDTYVSPLTGLPVVE